MNGQTKELDHYVCGYQYFNTTTGILKTSYIYVRNDSFD